MADSKNMEVDNALRSHIQLIDKVYLRKMQKAAYECSATCCDSSTASTQEVEYCVEKCNHKLIDSHNYVTAELANYQERLQRCVSQCNDEAKDQMGVIATEALVEKASKYFEDCACQCIDKHIGILPQFMSRVHEVMAKKLEAATGIKVPGNPILGPI